MRQKNRESQVHAERPGKIDRNKIYRIRFYIKSYNARMRERGQHGGPVTHTHQKVFDAIVSFINWTNGNCFPSLATISARAGCACSTVIEALKTLEAAGILARVRRAKLITRRVGGRIYRIPARTSNGYVFLMPTILSAVLAPIARAVRPDPGPHVPRDHAGLAIFAAQSRQGAPGPTFGRGCETRLDAAVAAARIKLGVKPIAN